MKLSVYIGLLAFGLAGCTLEESKSTAGSGGPISVWQSWPHAKTPQLPEDCTRTTEAGKRLANVHSTVVQSVHELITCGNLQLSIASSLQLAVLASNPEFLTKGQAALLGPLPTKLLSVDPQGRLSMEIAQAPGSTFRVQLSDPKTGLPIKHNPLLLSSYLVGAKLTRNVTTAQVLANSDLPVTFSIAWTAKGPLAHLLNDGLPLPNPIVVTLSANEQFALLEGSLPRERLGAFGSLNDLQMAGEVEYVATKYDVSITYTALTAKGSIGQLAKNGLLNFSTLKLVAHDMAVSEVMTAHSIEVVKFIGLTGKIAYVSSLGSLATYVQDDFGAGALYPTTTYSCSAAFVP